MEDALKEFKITLQMLEQSKRVDDELCNFEIRELNFLDLIFRDFFLIFEIKIIFKIWSFQ